jgi:hypothetical protein
MTHKPKYQTVRDIQDVEFAASTSNKFGPGQGTIVIGTVALSLSVSDDGYFVCLAGEEYIYFSDTAEYWYPDQLDSLDMEGLAKLDLLFVFAGVLCKHTGTNQETFTKYVGLVIKKTTTDVYERVGFIEGEFNTNSCDGTWSDWRGRASKQQIKLV